MWAAAAGFWLFVAAMSAAQIAWIPVTIGVWHVTRGWLPERFGGWLRLMQLGAEGATAVL